jgi:hypothetical protein
MMATSALVGEWVIGMVLPQQVWCASGMNEGF